MLNYPFYLYIYWRTITLFGVNIRCPGFHLCDVNLSPAYWATHYTQPLPVKVSHPYYDDDYYDDDYYDDNYYDDEEYYEESCEQDEEYGPTLCTFGDLLIYEVIFREDGFASLVSNCILIADIDCGDDIKTPLLILQDYIDLNGGSFLVYKTKNGMRYIQTDTLYQGVNQRAISVLNALGSDPKYINYSRRDGKFVARITPKLTSEEMKEYRDSVVSINLKSLPYRICSLIGKFHSNKEDFIIQRQLLLFLETHDYACRVEENYLPLM